MENKKICQICSGELSEQDDVVVCPTCGAPHHRECYFSLGQCGREQDHGTDKQYDLEQKAKAQETEEKIKKVRCGNCGTEITEENPKICPHCGKHFSRIIRLDSFPTEEGEQSEDFANKVLGNIFVDALGGVNPKTMIEDVSAKEVASFVAVSTNRYLPKFCKLSKDKKTSWNWAAFLFPTAWCFFRKMYKDGFIYLLVHLIGCLMLLPMMSFVYSCMGGLDTAAMNYTQMLETVMANMDSFNSITAIIYMLGVGVFATKHIYAGVMSDWNYRKHCILTINSIKNNAKLDTEEKEYMFLKKGTVNLFTCLLGVALENYMLTILATLLL